MITLQECLKSELPQDVLFKSLNDDKISKTEIIKIVYDSLSNIVNINVSGKYIFKTVKRFIKSYKNSHYHKKRKLVFFAFWNSFKPKFYKNNLSKELWKKLKNLEYCDLDYLQRVINACNSNQLLPIDVTIPDAEFADRLVDRDLITLNKGRNEEYSENISSRPNDIPIPIGLAKYIIEFVFDDFWNSKSDETRQDMFK